MPGQRQIGGGKGSGGCLRSGGGSSKSNVTKISNKKTMGKTEAKVRVKTDRMKKSPAAKDIASIKGAVKLNNKAKAAIIATGATANAVRISKNKSKSVPVPRNPRKQ